MGAAAQFDLDVAMATWRRFLASARGLSGDDLDELEAHLRDEVDALLQAGWPPEQAFREAQRRLGDYGTIEAAYRDLYWMKLRHEHRLGDQLIHALAMLKNHLIVAWRQLARRKVLTFINRTKEIGIRKALGASSSSIVLMLSKNFAGLMSRENNVTVVLAARTIPGRARWESSCA